MSRRTNRRSDFAPLAIPSRRSFLAALGASTLFAGRRSFAAPNGAATPPRSGRAPLRFIGIYTPHGRAHELWQPREHFDISFPESILAPFDDPKTYGKSFKDRLVVLDGVDLSAGILVGTTGHDGPRVILTGSGADGKTPSIDQFLAVDRGLGADTPHASIALGVGHDQSGIGFNISYAAGGTPIPKWIDPSQSFAELFGTAMTGARQDELERQRSEGKSVLDAVRADLARLGAAASLSDRWKIEQHQASLREIEKRLTAERPKCELPPVPDPNRFRKVRAFGGGEPFFDTITDLQIDLLARALACDVSRFATLYLADLTRSSIVPGLPDDIHNDVAHRYDARTDKYAGNPSTWYPLAAQNRYTAGKIARLMQRLDEAGILDDCVIYASGDMGDPARHSSRSVPTLLAGGCGGRFKMGRHLDLRREAGGTPNNRVLVSICQAFGQPIERFGHATDPAVLTGRLEELHA